MLLWFVAPAVVAVWVVFRDPRADYRFVALGALVPDAVDLPVGHPAFGHTLLAAAGTLAVAVVATVGRRRWRGRLVLLPIGMLFHLVLAGVFSEPDVFWWPFLGTELPELAFRPSAGAVALRELAGLVVAGWFVRRFQLTSRSRLRRFLATGRVEVTPA